MNESIESLLLEVGKIKNDESSFNPLNAKFGRLENTHSDIIAKLLEAKWELLDSFVQKVLPSISISKKKKISREEKGIDILIEDGENAIIIENKIRAGDQPEQLIRYHEVIKNRNIIKDENIHVLYLTPYGHEPSENSKGCLTKVKPISYESHILPWLEDWIKDNEGEKSELKMFVKLYAEQVRNTINRDKYMEAVLEKCFETNDNVLAAIDIYNSIRGRNFLDIEKLRLNFQEQIRNAVEAYEDTDGWLPQDGGWQLFVEEYDLTFSMYGSSIYAKDEDPNEIKCNDLNDVNLLHLLKKDEDGIAEWVAKYF